MSKSRLFLVLAALVALAVPATASAATDPLEPKQWHMVAPKSGQPFTMFNEINNSQFGLGSRTFGADLEWGSRGQWLLVRQRVNGVTDHRPAIRSDEKLALYNVKARKYLVNKSQKFGINLDWSGTASYQWKVNHEAAKFHGSLYNTQAADYLVYGKRSFGINLQWLKDRRKAAQVEAGNAVGTIHDASVTMTAEPVVQGYVPFRGTYGGGGTKAVLTKVANPAGGAPLFFVKPGYSTAQCGNSAAVLRLGPGETMTADQMKTLWASATPSLAQPVPFLACAATQYSSVRINVQYRVTG